MTVFDGAFDPAAIETAGDVLIKLGFGALIGGAIGYERELHGRPAGIRTHMMMVIGVVLFSEVSKAFAPNDGARIAAQILTGVGFLGAGTILRMGVEIKGLTSAASIWAAAALGMAVSVGGPFLWVALFGTVLSLLTLAVVDNLERRLVPGAHARNLQVVLAEAASLPLVLEALEKAGADVQTVRVAAHGPPCTIVMDVQGRHGAIVSALAAMPQVEQCNWTT